MQRAGRILILSTWLVAVGAAEIRVVGSDLLGDGFARAVAEFARQEETVVKLDLSGTRPGLEELEAGRADVGVLLLPAAEPAPGGSIVSRIIGYQVTVIVVPATSPLTQVTLPRLRGWFGAISGERPPALLAMSPRAGLAWPLFQLVGLQGAEPKVGVEFFAEEAAFAQRLRATEHGIGIVGAGAAADTGLRVLALAAGPTEPAYAPTPENVHRGHYPLRMVMYVAFRRADAPRWQRFLKFLLSDEAARALAPAGHVALPAGLRKQLVFELEEMH